MKKFASLMLALALCMGLAVPAIAAEVSSDKHTYVLSNDPVKTMEYVQTGINVATGKEVIHRYTVYLVPEGTTVREANDLRMSGCIFDDLTIEPRTLPASKSYDITNGSSNSVYLIGTVKPEYQNESYFRGFVSDLMDDEGIWLASADYTSSLLSEPGASAEPAEPAAPAEPESPAQPAQPAAPEQPVQPSQPAVIPEGSVAYTVQKGDTLGFIATNFYGNNAQREALYQANIEAFRATKGALKPGMVLAIPAVLNKAVRLAAPVAAEGEKLYTVKAGDTLGQIAAAEYGNMNQYKAIFERNADRLKNANTIYEGQVIVLPAK